jgi:hypothetical protein
MATYDAFAENRYNPSPKKQYYNKTENFYFRDYETVNQKEKEKEQETKKKQRDAEKTEENIKAEAYNFVNILENILWGDTKKDMDDDKYETIYPEPTIEKILSVWIKAGEKLKEKYNLYKNETDKLQKEYHKIFLREMLEEFKRYSEDQRDRPSRHLRCPTTFVGNKDDYYYNYRYYFEPKDNRDLPDKYSTWYIPKDEFRNFAKEIGLSEDTINFYEEDRENYILTPMNKAINNAKDKASNGFNYVRGIFSRSARINPVSSTDIDLDLKEGGKKRNQSKKSKKSKKRRTKRR